VAISALAGMVLGGLFGLASGRIAPGFFAELRPVGSVEPTGFATVLGAFGGTLCGGALGAFGLVLELVAGWRISADRVPPHGG